MYTLEQNYYKFRFPRDEELTRYDIDTHLSNSEPGVGFLFKTLKEAENFIELNPGWSYVEIDRSYKLGDNVEVTVYTLELWEITDDDDPEYLNAIKQIVSYQLPNGQPINC